jgi:hypothetical protein
MRETFEEFCKRMSEVPKEWERPVGRASSGNSRALFVFEGQHCCLNTTGMFPVKTVTDAFRAAFTPVTEEWWHDRLICSEHRARKIAAYYEGRVQEEFYPEQSEVGIWFFLVLDDFTKLMRVVYDVYTGDFDRKWLKERTAYSREYERAIPPGYDTTNVVSVMV